jgi:hypothetical protein
MEATGKPEGFLDKEPGQVGGKERKQRANTGVDQLLRGRIAAGEARRKDAMARDAQKGPRQEKTQSGPGPICLRGTEPIESR